jgi:hypothetical protein
MLSGSGLTSHYPSPVAKEDIKHSITSDSGDVAHTVNGERVPVKNADMGSTGRVGPESAPF